MSKKNIRDLRISGVVRSGPMKDDEFFLTEEMMFIEKMKIDRLKEFPSDPDNERNSDYSRLIKSHQRKAIMENESVFIWMMKRSRKNEGTQIEQQALKKVFELVDEFKLESGEDKIRAVMEVMYKMRDGNPNPREQGFYGEITKLFQGLKKRVPEVMDEPAEYKEIRRLHEREIVKRVKDNPLIARYRSPTLEENELQNFDEYEEIVDSTTGHPKKLSPKKMTTPTSISQVTIFSPAQKPNR